MEGISDDLFNNQNQANGYNSHHVIIEITEADKNWLNSMEGRINQVPKLLNESAGKESCCIFRVPRSLFKINEMAYLPHILSIGPYHHGKEQLKMIEEHKWRFLGFLLSKTQENGVDLNHFFNAISPLEEDIRECYSETIQFCRHEFIEIMVLDGCFIITLFLIVGNILSYTNFDDPIFSMAWILPSLMRDLLRLENQIPFFVLQTLFQLSKSALQVQNVPTLTELTLGFFNYAVVRPDEVLKKRYHLEGKHLLDRSRSSFIPIPSQQTPTQSTGCLQLFHSAKKLCLLIGIWLKARKTDCFKSEETSREGTTNRCLQLNRFNKKLHLAGIW